MIESACVFRKMHQPSWSLANKQGIRGKHAEDEAIAIKDYE
jgi:hypothetical protein